MKYLEKYKHIRKHTLKIHLIVCVETCGCLVHHGFLYCTDSLCCTLDRTVRGYYTQHTVHTLAETTQNTNYTCYHQITCMQHKPKIYNRKGSKQKLIFQTTWYPHEIMLPNISFASFLPSVASLNISLSRWSNSS